MMLSEGQMSDHKGAALMLDALPDAKALLGDKGYDSNGFRQALVDRGITPCIPSSRSRNSPLPYDAVLYRQGNRIERMFGRLKDWRRIATRYDRCAHTFFVRIRPAPQFRVAREVSPAERVCAASGRLSQGCGSSVGLPIPGQQFVEVLGRVIGQPSEHVGQPSLGIDIVEFGSLN